MARISTEELLSFPPDPLEKKRSAPEAGFSERLTEAVGEVNRLKLEGGEAMEKMVEGSMGIHEGMMALGKADVSFRLLMQVRAKVVAAYSEMMRMPV